MHLSPALYLSPRIDLTNGTEALGYPLDVVASRNLDAKAGHNAIEVENSHHEGNFVSTRGKFCFIAIKQNCLFLQWENLLLQVSADRRYWPDIDPATRGKLSLAMS